MSKRKRSYVGKIGYCDNKILGIKDRTGKIIKGGHYVYIREMQGDSCNVNVITSLEDKNGFYDFKKIHKIKNGYLYPIPKTDANFKRWSAINLDGNIKNIKTTDIHNIGCKSIKNRHRWFPYKFTKK